jgi:hypothetical protein
MKTIYLVKHQHGGMLTSHAFANMPTEAQIEAMGKNADGIFGQEGFAEVRECKLIEGGDVPEFVALNSAGIGGSPGEGTAGATAIVGEGVGTVTPA